MTKEIIKKDDDLKENGLVAGIDQLLNSRKYFIEKFLPILKESQDYFTILGKKSLAKGGEELFRHMKMNHMKIYESFIIIIGKMSLNTNPLLEILLKIFLQEKQLRFIVLPPRD